MKKTIIFLAVFSALILFLSVRGLPGNPTLDTLNSKKWKDNGPFELSPERARFALTYSVAEDKSVSFSKEIARFALPDLGYKNGKYVSLFAPAVSYLALPGYFFGKIFGASQVGSYLTVVLFAVFNVCLICLIARKLGAGKIASFISSLIFIFATPSFSYATTLYQHHISTFLILMAFYILLSEASFKKTMLVWLLWGISISVDYPNFLMMAPLVIFSLFKLIARRIENHNLKITVNLRKLTGVFAILVPLLYFFWFNWASYGSFFQLAGTVQDVSKIRADGTPVLTKENHGDDIAQDASNRKTAIGFFRTRNILKGLNIHFLSPDRGVIYYTPIILFGILGFSLLNRQKNSEFSILIAIAAVNIILYSMWGDPWGGWSFGSRYLIPSYAIFSIFIAFAFERYIRKEIFAIAFYLAMLYSVLVNTLGAVTTSLNPPKAEAEALSQKYKKAFEYTPKRNLNFLQDHGSKSFVYKAYFQESLEGWQYFFIISFFIIFVLTSPYIYLFVLRDLNVGSGLSEKLQNLIFEIRENIMKRFSFLPRY